MKPKQAELHDSNVLTFGELVPHSDKHLSSILCGSIRSSMMGEISFFLGLNISLKSPWILPWGRNPQLDEDKEGKAVRSVTSIVFSHLRVHATPEITVVILVTGSDVPRGKDKPCQG
ncbi:hypothetical protein Tco_0199010 [Tanacetum coccineum]|uniref:Uncharacterized protein n=1 Tax=Tanacetum coccineum TaxID=301880 RepID=A0ABQ5HCZ0_9ASTR